MSSALLGTSNPEDLWSQVPFASARRAARWPRVRYGPVLVDALDMSQALDQIAAAASDGQGGYVVTPNVAHLSGVRRNPNLAPVYEHAMLSLADGVPLVWWSRLLGLPVAEKLSGSDLVIPLLQRVALDRIPVFLLGSTDEVNAKATTEAERLAPGLEVVGSASPMVRGEGDELELLRALREARRRGARLVIVTLGNPKQEIVMHHHGWRVPGAVFVGLGASLDFLAGAVPRSPPWMSACGLEWLFRLCREPRRLWRRYLLDCPGAIPIFAGMLNDHRCVIPGAADVAAAEAAAHDARPPLGGIECQVKTMQGRKARAARPASAAGGPNPGSFARRWRPAAPAK